MYMCWSVLVLICNVCKREFYLNDGTESRFAIHIKQRDNVHFSGLVYIVALFLPYARASDATCKQHNNVIIGNSFIKKTTTPSADACCSACFEYGYGCQAFTYQLSTKFCESTYSTMLFFSFVFGPGRCCALVGLFYFMFA